MRTTFLGAFLVGVFYTNIAFADKVAVLPFRTTTAQPKDLTQLSSAATGATTDRGHTIAIGADLSRAEKSSKDGVFDSQAEFVAAGKAAQANWTLSAKVEWRGANLFAVDLEACQVESGRVESVARDIEPDKARTQIREMLALLLRPEGVAGAELPWKKNAPLPPIPIPEPVKETPKPPEKKEEPPPPPPVPPTPQEPARAYGEGHPYVGGLSLGVLSALARPSGAVGNATSLLVQASFGIALESVRGLEFRIDAGGGTIGPASFLVDGGARYAVLVSKEAPRVYLGPEAKIGAFIPFAGDKKARFLARGGAFVGFEVTPELAFELAPNVSVAAGGSGALAFFDAEVGAFYRF